MRAVDIRRIIAKGNLVVSIRLNTGRHDSLQVGIAGTCPTRLPTHRRHLCSFTALSHCLPPIAGSVLAVLARAPVVARSSPVSPSPSGRARARRSVSYRFGIPVVGLCSVLLLGCVAASNGSTAPAKLPAQPPSAAGTASTPPNAMQVAQMTPGPITLPPLNLPHREDWSSPQCPDLAVTFSGPAQPARTTTSDTASFQEARYYRENDYYEIAEAFGTKGSNLSETTKATADAIMAQTAQQLTELPRLRVRRISFIEDGPLGKYSEVEGAVGSPSSATFLLRMYWRGQCSMRIATVSVSGTEARARQFVDSLREVKPAAAAQQESAPPSHASTETQDSGGRAKQRAMMIHERLPATLPPAAGTGDTRVDAASGQSIPTGAAARLRQLKELSDGGLLTPEEFERKRRAILDAL